MTMIDARQLDKLDHDQVSIIPIDSIHPAPENDVVYGRIDPGAADVVELAASIIANGIQEALVVSSDGFIVSGHRRYAAAKLAKLDHVPVRYHSISYWGDRVAFVILLREFNRQREKTLDQRLREELIDINPVDARRDLVEYRRKRSHVEGPSRLNIIGTIKRCAISAAKSGFLQAVLRIIEDRREYLPLSDRQIHYALLNNPPLIHGSKPASRYRNSLQSYKSLVDLLTRARLAGSVPMEAISDETRPVTVWRTWQTAGGFIADAKNEIFRGYARDLMQSQENHIELVGEKNTIKGILEPVAMRYTIPLTTGRGYASLPPRAAIVERFRRSGKSRLVLLVVSDFDPDGEGIAQSLARSIRDDFGVDDLHPVKVALTRDQVKRHQLPSGLDPREKKSSRLAGFLSECGEAAYELEALPPATLQQIVADAIDSVINIEAFNAELKQEEEDARFLEGVRRVCARSLADMDFREEEKR